MTALTLDLASWRPATAWLAKLIPSKAPHPILSGVLIAPTDVPGEVTASVYDYTTHATVSLPVDGQMDHPVLMSARLLAEALAHMATPARLAVDEDCGRVTVTDGRRTIWLHGMARTDYPPVPTPPAPSGVIDAQVLASLVSRAVAMASRNVKDLDTIRAVQLVSDGEAFWVYGTDRHRLAASSTPWDGAAFRLMIQPRTITAALGALAGPVSVGADDAHLSLSDGRSLITLGLTDGEPPAVERLVSTSGGGEPLTLPRADTLSALDAAMTGIPDGASVRLEIADGQALIAATSEAASTEAIVPDATGGPFSFLVNPWLFISILKVLDGDTATIHPTGDSALKPLTITGSDPAATFLLVPMRPR